MFRYILIVLIVFPSTQICADEGVNFMGIPDVETSTYPFHFALWLQNQRIDVWTTSDGQNHAQIAFWATESKSINKNKLNSKTCSQIVELPKSVASDLVNFVDSLIKDTLPKIVEPWLYTYCGPEYYYASLKKSDEYQSISIVNPKEFKEQYAGQFALLLVEKFRNASSSSEHWKRFYELIPFNTFYVSGGGSSVYLNFMRNRVKRKKLKYWKQNDWQTYIKEHL